MKRLVLVVFEGIDFYILMDWINNSSFPGFTRLIEDGFLNHLQTGLIPYEAAGLCSAFSGFSESQHGVLSYWKAHNPNYDPELWDSKDIKSLMFWNRPEFANHRLLILNVFGTCPVYEVNGYLISYSMNRTTRYMYPFNLSRELYEKGLTYKQDLFVMYKGQSASEFYKKVKTVESARWQVFLELYQRNIDLAVVNFTIVDRVSHFFMNELRQRDNKLEETVVYQAYKFCDGILVNLINLIEHEPDTELIVFSEIGFGHLKKFVNINDYLQKRGFLKWDEDTQRPDWKRTIAFESVQGTHGVNLNLKGCYREGVIDTKEYLDVLHTVISELRLMKNPYCDQPMFSNVYAKAECLSNHPALPDIIVEPYDLRYLPYGDNLWANYVNRNSQTGWHRNSGFIGGIGPDLSSINSEQIKSLTDIVPMIYKLYRIPYECK